MEETKSDHIDEGLYSRQLLVVGKEAMARMQNYSVLITGMTGLGAEVAKNVILAGVKKVTIHDDTTTEPADFSSQFYLGEDDVGKPRAAACLSRLQELNQYVDVQAATGDLTEDVLKAFNLVVVIDSKNVEELKRINRVCRDNGVHFMASGSHGLVGYAFTDLGDTFTVVDRDGEKVKEGVVVSITDEGVIEAEEHGLADGDHVVFFNVEGMLELNDTEPRPVKVISKDSFSIEGIDGYSKYTRGGYYREVKQPVEIKFKSFEDSLASPDLTMNILNFDRPAQLHGLMRALWSFATANGGRFPAPHNATEAEAVVADAKKILGEGESKMEVDEASEKALFRLAAVSSGSINPMAAVFGGVVGQEVMKASSGRFTPIQQFFYHDAVECLPSTFPLSEGDVKLEGTRYDGQIAVFGKEFQGKLENLRVFLVGAGALGCEFLKNYALTGVGCGGSGHVLVTDMDSIEKSNLNRQFLFRPHDVTKMKSSTAAAAAKAMNGALNVDAVCDKIAPDTEAKYNAAFWTGLSVVVSALDNVQARLYIDSKCVEARRPLLESGTLGTKCHTQNILPHKTLSYASYTDPADNSFPVCTLKFFPNLIEHTLQWARDEFELLFHNNPEEVSLYLTRPDHVDQVRAQRSTALDRLGTLHACLGDKRPKSFADCVRLARIRFQETFVNNILELLEQYPLDHIVGDEPFWSAKKRPPTPAEFSADDPLHMQYIVAAANLLARQYGIPESDDTDAIKRELAGVTPPPFVPSKKKIAANDEEAKKLAEEEAKKAELGDLDTAIADLASKIPPVSELAGLSVVVEEFEKDDDTNRHMDFIAAAGNLRARQYRIPEADNLKAKQIVGRIVPAIATTTALATGLVMLELYKLVQDHPLESFRDSNVNLGINQYSAFEPPEAPKKTFKGRDWTLWDTIDIDAATLQDVCDHFQDELELELLMISTTGSDTVVLFDANDFEAIEEDHILELPVPDVYSKVTGKSIEAGARYLLVDVMVEDPDDPDAEVDLPPVRIALPAAGAGGGV